MGDIHRYNGATLTPADIEREVTRQAIAAWLGFWLAFGVGDYLVHRRRRTTLSKAGRVLFRTETKAGRAAFTAAFAAGAAILWRHVVDGGGR